MKITAVEPILLRGDETYRSVTGGQEATGYSIPRDDVVNFPHSVTVGGAIITEGKIDAAYLYAYDQYVSANVGTMGTTPALYTGANQAGQLFETQTVVRPAYVVPQTSYGYGPGVGYGGWGWHHRYYRGYGWHHHF